MGNVMRRWIQSGNGGQARKLAGPVSGAGTGWALVAVVLFRITLDLCYYLVISHVWAYDGFVLTPDLFRVLESYLLLVVVFGCLPKSAAKLTDFFVCMLVLVAYVPMLTLFALAGSDRVFTYAATGFWIIVLCLTRLPAVSLPVPKDTGVILLVLGSCLTICVLAVVYFKMGFSLTLDLGGVYDIRRRYVALAIPIAGYVFNWVALIVAPAGFAWFVSRKRWAIASAIVVVQLLLFSATGHKVYLFALPFVAVLMWLTKRRRPLAVMATGLAVVTAAGAISHWAFGDMWLSHLFARRTLLLPAYLSYQYYDFFSENGPVFLSHSVLRFFFDYPYQLDPPHLIAQVYYNNPGMGANNGVVGDAFMNFGFPGLVLWAVILAGFIKLLDSCSRKVNLTVGVGAMAVPVFTLSNSALLTNLLTGGVLVAALVLYLMPKEDSP